MDLIGDIIPQVNGYCTNTTQATLVRKITFYVTTAREFFLLNAHRANPTFDQTAQEYINFDPNGYVCCEQNDYLDLRSPVPFELDINWDDGTDIDHVIATKSGNFYYIRWYSVNSDYYRKFTGNGTDGQKDQMIASFGFKNHIFEGQKKEHTVTMTFTKGYIDYIYANYIKFGKYPLFEVPELKTISTNECPCDVVNTDRFLYCPNIENLGLRNIASTKYNKFPDSLWQLTNLKYLYIDSFVNNPDVDTNGLRNISKLKNLRELTLHGCVNKYIKEFNDLPNLYYLKTTYSFNKDILDNFFSETTTINPKITNMQIGSCWSDDTVPSTNYEYASLPMFNNVADLSNIRTIGNYYQVPKGKKLVIQDWMDRAFNISGLGFNKVFGQDKTTSTTIDLGIEAIYEHATQFGYNSTYKDGDYKGKRNPWYGMRFSGYSQSQPYNHRPSGTYQAPEGFVKGTSDGTPSSAMEMVYVLVNNYKWTFILAPEAGNVNTNPGETIKPQSLENSNEILVASLDDLDAIESDIDETIDYEANPIQVDGRILIVDEDGNIQSKIEGDPGKIDVFTPDDLDTVAFANEDDVKEYCEENDIEYSSI